MSGTERVRRFLPPNWDTISLAILVCGWLIASFPLSSIAGRIPRIALSVTRVLLVVQLLTESRTHLSFSRNARQSGGPGPHAAASGEAHDEADRSALVGGEPGASPTARATRPARAMLWIGGMFLLVLALGATAGTTLFCFAYLRWYVCENWVTSSAYALGLGSSVQLIFGMLLQANLYQGWLLAF